MILFCEDCGNKNSIGPYQVTNSKAVFRCSTCNFLNSITIGKNTIDINSKASLDIPNTIEKTPENLIRIIKTTPDIFGFFLFHIKTGIFQNHMPAVLLPQDLEIIGKILISNTKICSFQFPDITRQILVIEGKNLVLQMINETCGLVLACSAFPLTIPQEKMLNQISRIKWNLKG